MIPTDPRPGSHSSVPVPPPRALPMIVWYGLAVPLNGVLRFIEKAAKLLAGLVIVLLLGGCAVPIENIETCRKRCEEIGLAHDATIINLLGPGVQCICRKPATDGGCR